MSRTVLLALLAVATLGLVYWAWRRGLLPGLPALSIAGGEPPIPPGPHVVPGDTIRGVTVGKPVPAQIPEGVIVSSANGIVTSVAECTGSLEECFPAGSKAGNALRAGLRAIESGPPDQKPPPIITKDQQPAGGKFSSIWSNPTVIAAQTPPLTSAATVKPGLASSGLRRAA
jgi:hypothetical protein